jgi:formylglycine-generating enzyme required for sulfatase activity
MTAMPGETLSCVGCHEKRNTAPPAHTTIAGTRPPAAIEPWRGPTRGFSFGREVQPVLDKYCVGCHNGQPDQQGRQIVDLRGGQNAFVVFRGGDPQGQVVRDVPKEKLLGKYGGVFPPSYLTLRSFVRAGGLESDLHVLPPMEFHADTTELIQMLRKGHHHVQMDDEAWDRLYTWIDLNAPCHGTWAEVTRIPGDQRRRRCELRKLYGGVEEDAEEVPEVAAAPVQPIVPEPEPEENTRVALAARQPVQETRADKPPVPPSAPGWPFDAAEAARRQQSAGPLARTITIGGVRIDMVKIPAGSFVIGDAGGYPDERPLTVVKIDKPFWMSKHEITNRQYAEFDPTHESRFEHRTSWIFSEQYLGWPLNGSEQPVVRVSWNQAMAYCRWLSQQTGQQFTLPTEAEWEYACRAGTATPLWYGGLDADFSPAANMADYSIRNLAYEGWRPRSPDIAPRDARFNDHALVTAAVGSYRANPWGLCDMHGNAAEWTRSKYAPYPYRADDGRNDPAADGQRVVRGGSWYDRPQRCRSALRLAYAPYQRVFNVGFRVVCQSP